MIQAKPEADGRGANSYSALSFGRAVNSALSKIRV
jgi:hypothetical protein